MWIADGWKDYELLDCGGGEKLERWGDQILVRPDPQAIWESDRKNRGGRTANARYSRSSTGGGHWDKNKLPESWPIAYKNLRFQVKPMNFKHTGLFPEQAANWDFAMDQIRRAGRPIRVLNLFAYTGGATVACAAAGASVCHSIADKVSSLLLFTPEIMLHVSRPIRWDSDHVVILSDDLLDLAREIIRCDALDRVHIGLDYFDATINRIGAYVIGSRATQKAFMQALLEPRAALEKYEEQGRYFQRLALQEEAKSLPWNAVWDMYCQMKETPVGESFIGEIEKYEREVTSKR